MAGPIHFKSIDDMLMDMTGEGEVLECSQVCRDAKDGVFWKTSCKYTSYTAP